MGVEPRVARDQLELSFADRAVVAPADRVSGVREHVGHPAVLAQETGAEAADAPRRGALHQQLEEDRAETTPLAVVADHERDLGQVVVDEVVLPDGHELVAHFGAQYAVTGVVGGDGAGAGRDVAGERGEEPQAARPVGRCVVERAHAVGVAGPELADPRRLPVGQEHIPWVGRSCGHGHQVRRLPPARLEANLTGVRREPSWRSRPRVGAHRMPTSASTAASQRRTNSARLG